MKKALIIITAAIGVALLALLVYSVERSAWLLSMYEALAVDGGDQSGPALAMAAALVAELGAIALIVGEAAIGLVGNKDTARRLARWAGFGLLLVLSLQSVAGLVAGYTRGGDRMLATLGGAGGSGVSIYAIEISSDQARFAVAAVALLLGNLTVPGLILALSKIAAILVGQIVAMPPEPASASGATIDLSMPAYALARPAEQPALGHVCGACGKPIEGESCGHCGASPKGASMPSTMGMKGMRHACSACGHDLSAGQAGAAKRWGHCTYCKGLSKGE